MPITAAGCHICQAGCWGQVTARDSSTTVIQRIKATAGLTVSDFITLINMMLENSLKPPNELREDLADKKKRKPTWGMSLGLLL